MRPRRLFWEAAGMGGKEHVHGMSVYIPVLSLEQNTSGFSVLSHSMMEEIHYFKK